jgi:hypothetical protein
MLGNVTSIWVNISNLLEGERPDIEIDVLAYKAEDNGVSIELVIDKQSKGAITNCIPKLITGGDIHKGRDGAPEDPIMDEDEQDDLVVNFGHPAFQKEMKVWFDADPDELKDAYVTMACDNAMASKVELQPLGSQSQ